MGERLRAASLASLEPTRRRRLGRVGRRWLRPVPAIAAIAAVAAILGALILATPSDPPTAQADATGVELVRAPCRTRRARAPSRPPTAWRTC